MRPLAVLEEKKVVEIMALSYVRSEGLIIMISQSTVVQDDSSMTGGYRAGINDKES